MNATKRPAPNACTDAKIHSEVTRAYVLTVTQSKGLDVLAKVSDAGCCAGFYVVTCLQ